MLYGLWSQVVREHPNEVILRHPELSGGWTAAEIDRRARRIGVPPSGFLIARGDAPDFFPTILAAWQDKAPVLILESRQTQAMEIRSEIPPHTALIKQTCGAAGVERSLFFGETQVLAEGRRNIAALGLHRERCGIAAISLAHSYGFGCLALPMLLGGIPIHALASPLPVLVRKTLEGGGEFFLPGVPALWKTWWLTKTLDVPSLGLALSAGSPLSLDLESGIWNDTGTKLHNFYGTTETGAVAFDHASTPRIDGRTIGKVLPGVHASLTVEGRIQVRTDAAATGSDILLAEDEFDKSHYLTMDMGDIRDGQLLWQDHVGRAINVAGRKVSPEKIKRACLCTPGVSEVSVSGIRSGDIERFEEVKVSLRIDGSTDLKTLKESVQGKLDSWEVPRCWEVRSH